MTRDYFALRLRPTGAQFERVTRARSVQLAGGDGFEWFVYDEAQFDYPTTERRRRAYVVVEASTGRAVGFGDGTVRGAIYGAESALARAVAGGFDLAAAVARNKPTP